MTANHMIIIATVLFGQWRSLFEMLALDVALLIFYLIAIAVLA